MVSRRMRVYAETSVYGGAFDPEFEKASTTFFHQVRGGEFTLVTSSVVQQELRGAPPSVRQLFDDLQTVADWTAVSGEALQLAQAYLDAGVVTERSATDALHVALATLADCDILLSWNFRDIVHIQKAPLYNAVNTLKGYPNIAIYSPPEVVTDETEEKEV